MFVKATGVLCVARVATTCTFCNSTLFSVSNCVSNSAACVVATANKAASPNNLFIFLLPYLIIHKIRGCSVLLYLPYAGIIRIRFEGIISAHNSEHPLTSTLLNRVQR